MKGLGWLLLVLLAVLGLRARPTEAGVPLPPIPPRGVPAPAPPVVVAPPPPSEVVVQPPAFGEPITVPEPSTEPGLPFTVRTVSGRVWTVESYLAEVAAIAKAATGVTTVAKRFVLEAREAGQLLGQPSFGRVCVAAAPSTEFVSVPSTTHIRIREVNTGVEKIVADDGSSWGPGTWQILGPATTQQSVTVMKCVEWA